MTYECSEGCATDKHRVEKVKRLRNFEDLAGLIDDLKDND
jgi:hypothetical protein